MAAIYILHAHHSFLQAVLTRDISKHPQKQQRQRNTFLEYRYAETSSFIGDTSVPIVERESEFNSAELNQPRTKMAVRVNGDTALGEVVIDLLDCETRMNLGCAGVVVQ